jgi:hypothetical protein
VALNFTGDANQRVGERISLRAAVTVSDPPEFPSCAAGVLISIEIIDRLTHATQVILTNPALQQVQRRARRLYDGPIAIECSASVREPSPQALKVQGMPIGVFSIHWPKGL